VFVGDCKGPRDLAGAVAAEPAGQEQMQAFTLERVTGGAKLPGTYPPERGDDGRLRGQAQATRQPGCERHGWHPAARAGRLQAPDNAPARRAARRRDGVALRRRPWLCTGALSFAPGVPRAL